MTSRDSSESGAPSPLSQLMWACPSGGPRYRVMRTRESRASEALGSEASHHPETAEELPSPDVGGLEIGRLSPGIAAADI